MNIVCNRDKVRKLLSEIHGSLNLLAELGALSFDDFSSDRHRISSAKYNFIVAIEGMIDLCNHVIASNGWRTPEDYSDAFLIMTEAGAFKKDFHENLVKMARFRNRLVHLYWEIDTVFLYDVIQHNLNDFQRFSDELRAFLGL